MMDARGERCGSAKHRNILQPHHERVKARDRHASLAHAVYYVAPVDIALLRFSDAGHLHPFGPTARKWGMGWRGCHDLQVVQTFRSLQIDLHLRRNIKARPRSSGPVLKGVSPDYYTYSLCVYVCLRDCSRNE